MYNIRKNVEEIHAEEIFYNWRRNNADMNQLKGFSVKFDRHKLEIHCFQHIGDYAVYSAGLTPSAHTSLRTKSSFVIVWAWLNELLCQ